MRVLVDLYQVLSRKYLKIILIIVFGALSIHYFIYEIKIFIGLHEKYDIYVILDYTPYLRT